MCKHICILLLAGHFLLNLALTCQRYYIGLLPHRIPTNQAEVAMKL